MNEMRTTSRKTRVGKVVSDKMDKTIVVIVEDHVAHKVYKKIIGKTYRLKAHDENLFSYTHLKEVMEEELAS